MQKEFLFKKTNKKDYYLLLNKNFSTKKIRRDNKKKVFLFFQVQKKTIKKCRF